MALILHFRNMGVNQALQGNENVTPLERERPKKQVRFDCRLKYHVDSFRRTHEEIEQCWWSRGETQITKRSCQLIAKEAKRLWYMADCMDALYQAVTSKLFRDNLEREPYLLEMQVSTLLISCSRNFQSLRGLEYQVCNKRIRAKTRGKVCKMQRIPGMTEDLLARIAQNFSRFDRTIARLLGEADARHERHEKLTNGCM